MREEVTGVERSAERAQQLELANLAAWRAVGGGGRAAARHLVDACLLAKKWLMLFGKPDINLEVIMPAS